jgi:outer membrane biosynthesis protein TonB
MIANLERSLTVERERTAKMTKAPASKPKPKAAIKPVPKPKPSVKPPAKASPKKKSSMAPPKRVAADLNVSTGIASLG